MTSQPSRWGTGAVSTTGEGSNGVNVRAYDESAVTVNTTGAVTASVEGVNVHGGSSNPTKVTVTGSVTAGGTGVYANSIDGGMADVEITGDVTGSAYHGVLASSSGSTTDVTVGGDVTGGKDGIYTYAWNEGSISTVTVGTTDESGAITGGTVSAAENGVKAEASDGGSVTVKAGNVTATNGAGVTASSSGSGSTVTITVGSVTSGDDGIQASGSGTTVNAGDVTGSGVGVNATGGSTVKADNVTATNGDGIKVDGAANVTIDGTLTVTGGTPILLGDTVTETDAGNINIKVWEIQGQAAGGIYLHAEIEQLPEPKPDDPKPQPKPQPKPEAMNFVITWVEEPYTGSGKAETASVTFDLNGGQTIRGGKGPIVKEVPVDTWLRLIEAPVKEGAKFAGWKCSDPTVTETRPGYAFRVTHSVSFTALWTEA